jgi:hypothetical protein
VEDSKIKLTLLILITVIIIGASSADTYAASNNSLSVSFSGLPPNSIDQYQTYHLTIAWANSNEKKIYEGYFLFTVKSSSPAVKVSDVIFKYQGAAIQPSLSGNTLNYLLPKAAFAPSGHGNIAVDVYYNKPGFYSWTIGIIKR